MQKVTDAFLMKLLWKLITDMNSLVAKVFSHRYIRDKNIIGTLCSKQADSPLWKELVKLWPLLIENCSCNIGDGMRTLLWLNRWVQDEECLITKNLLHIEDIDIKAKVANLTDDSGGWNFHELRRVLPQAILEKIQTIIPPKQRMDDTIKWNDKPLFYGL
ncbi:hypothetical protein Ahy_A09g043515 [Arachis hypogaea]|uniref:Reverse transcriptase zinc-binding domain-containing protein n=1 Tax=Arachis hypogaea TaxID=3818 RepID=A0A445BIG7_ARAHY|nr:hypothetical protein Ahy_A09g043515 [Arachis hypogaea]